MQRRINTKHKEEDILQDNIELSDLVVRLEEHINQNDDTTG